MVDSNTFEVDFQNDPKEDYECDIGGERSSDDVAGALLGLKKLNHNKHLDLDHNPDQDSEEHVRFAVLVVSWCELDLAHQSPGL